MAEEKTTFESTETKAKKKKKISAIVWSCIGVALLILGICMFLFARQIFGNEIGDAVLGKDVPNGFVAIGKFLAENVSRLILTFIVIGFLSIISFLFRLIINLSSRKTARARTIGSLIKSLTKYLFIVLGICFVLGIWGVDVYGIFAGLGILGLIIGLGCKSLVNDIVSGFFIVVDNYFQVGERVIIDGFTGDIETIGLRTTKLKSWDGNLKSINNSLITSVVNLSRFNSVSIVKIDISYNEDLRRVEGIILKNLDSLTSKIPELKAKLKYGGVDGLDDNGVRLVFFGDVNEFDRFPTSRKILRELYLLLKENNVIIPFKQISVNNPDPKNRPKASKEELEVSNINAYSKVEKEVQKDCFKKKFESVLNQSRSGYDD